MRNFNFELSGKYGGGRSVTTTRSRIIVGWRNDRRGHPLSPALCLLCRGGLFVGGKSAVGGSRRRPVASSRSPSRRLWQEPPVVLDDEFPDGSGSHRPLVCAIKTQHAPGPPVRPASTLAASGRPRRRRGRPRGPRRGGCPARRGRVGGPRVATAARRARRAYPSGPHRQTARGAPRVRVAATRGRGGWWHGDAASAAAADSPVGWQRPLGGPPPRCVASRRVPLGLANGDLAGARA